LQFKVEKNELIEATAINGKSGKRMIWLIFMIGDHFGYSVYLTMLTDSFRQRMLERGALPTGIYDMLQIVKTNQSEG
jgi:hypothetical protein